MKRPSDEPLLGPTTISLADATAEYGRRRKEFETTTILAANQGELLAQGWQFDRRTKKRVRLKRLKPLPERLENRFWCLLFKMGYEVLNKGRRFTIRVAGTDEEPITKQIDVFAKNDDTVVIGECKTGTTEKKRNMQKDIGELASLKGAIANSVKQYYGNEFKPKIIWLLVTENIIWSKPDRERAAGERIGIITEREFRYFTQLVDHLGPAARHQFLAEYLAGQVIPSLRGTKIPATRGKLGGKRCFSFITTPETLLKVAFVNHRALNDPAGIPTYQRLIQRGRLRKIGTFIKSGGYFPTNILVNFKTSARFDSVAKDTLSGVHYGYLYFPDKYKSVWIIDGQHRLYGFSGLQEKLLQQNILVLAFDNISPEEEANLFVTINHEQKSVPRNLLDDLEGELKWGSTNPKEQIGAISSRLIGLLNADLGKPFYNKVTTPGIRATQRTFLTVPALKDGLRHSGLLGTVAPKIKKYDPGPFTGQSDRETLDRAADAITKFFELIREANPSAWDEGRDGGLCTNTGVQGFLRLFADLIAFMYRQTAQDPAALDAIEIVDQVHPYLQPVLDGLSGRTARDVARLFKGVPHGSGGPPEYRNRLCDLIVEKHPDFSPPGFVDWKKSQSAETTTLADSRVKGLVASVHQYLIDALKAAYGGDYWAKSIKSKDIRMKVFEKQLEDEATGEKKEQEAYLDVVDLKKIAEDKDNWPHVRDVLDIPMEGDKGLAKNLRWLEKLNRIRRIPGHPYMRSYAADDIAFLEWLEPELNGRLASWKSKQQNAPQPTTQSGSRSSVGTSQ